MGKRIKTVFLHVPTFFRNASSDVFPPQYTIRVDAIVPSRILRVFLMDRFKFKI